MTRIDTFHLFTALWVYRVAQVTIPCFAVQVGASSTTFLRHLIIAFTEAVAVGTFRCRGRGDEEDRSNDDHVECEELHLERRGFGLAIRVELVQSVLGLLMRVRELLFREIGYTYSFTTHQRVCLASQQGNLPACSASSRKIGLGPEVSLLTLSGLARVKPLENSVQWQRFDGVARK